MGKPEILAPVGGQEQLLAAVRCGADAVYLGAKGFNARRNAENFESSSLRDTVSLCHRHGVKVHVTVNTLVMDSELKQLWETAEEIAASGADAVIVQDLAVMDMFLHRYPTLEVHASTQCAVHNTDGVKFFQDMGVKRVVLARELSLKEIEKIRRETWVDLEVFIHGALCMCLSGGCYMSSMLGGRSGNRGLCAQPCRLNFKSRSRDYALSLKDMSHLKYARQLGEMGIASLKIEGRMKRPEYVAAAVTACRKALAGESYDEELLRSDFSRSGFTDGYATGKRTDMFGHRVKEDVTAASSKLLGQLSRLYDRENPVVPVDMTLKVGSSSVLSMSALGKTVSVSAEGAITALSQPTDEEIAGRFLSKTGGTQFYLRSLSFENKDNLMLPPSVMNKMRRDGLSLLDSELGVTNPHLPVDYSFPRSKYTPPKKAQYWARFESFEQLFSSPDIFRYILPLEEIDRHPEVIERFKDALTGEVPAVLFPENEDKIYALAEKLSKMGLSSLYCENVYGIELSSKLSLAAYGGASLNILNSPALENYSRLGLSAATVSYELSMSAAEKLQGSPKRGLIVYGYLPLMRVRSCPSKGEKGCGNCNGSPTITDRLGIKFPTKCHNRQFTTIFNSLPLHLGEKTPAPADFYTLYFTVESPEECKKAFDSVLGLSPFDKKRTGGLYYRTLM